ncbi:hypothetical protein P8452_38316 [Trifolium repens]|nr:hypothetical protein P8452_38316 [Trifolium repens]
MSISLLVEDHCSSSIDSLRSLTLKKKKKKRITSSWGHDISACGWILNGMRVAFILKWIKEEMKTWFLVS